MPVWSICIFVCSICICLQCLYFCLYLSTVFVLLFVFVFVCSVCSFVCICINPNVDNNAIMVVGVKCTLVCLQYLGQNYRRRGLMTRHFLLLCAFVWNYRKGWWQSTFYYYQLCICLIFCHVITPLPDICAYIYSFHNILTVGNKDCSQGVLPCPLSTFFPFLYCPHHCGWEEMKFMNNLRSLWWR